MQNTGKRCVILLVYIILRWSFNYESNVFRYNKILIDCVFGNSKFVVHSTQTIDLGFASVNSQCLRDNKLAIPSYPVNKYILLYVGVHSASNRIHCTSLIKLHYMSIRDVVIHVTCLHWRHFLYEMDICLKTGSCRKSKAGQSELSLCKLKLYVVIFHTHICTSKKL